MATQWLRRAVLLAAAGATALLVAACGGGSIASQFTPDRIIVFGDAVADLGQAGARYTVNDGSLNWTQYVAREFGRDLAASSAGGLSFATGNARVATEPDAAGNVATPTVAEQIEGFFQAGGGVTSGDLVIVNAGTSDLIAEAQAVITGAQTDVQMLANLTAAADALGAQVRRLVDAGATHVVVVGPYNLERTPWARQTGYQELLLQATRRFNQRLLVSMVDLGQSVLYVDAELQFNLYTGDAGAVSLANVADLVCTTVDPGPGIGTGTNQVNSARMPSPCTPATVVTPDYNGYLWADRVYPTPRGHELFGEYARDRIRDRW